LAHGEAGAPRKISPLRISALLTAASQGVSIDSMCLSAGVSRKSFYKWLTRGEDELARVGGSEEDPEVIVTEWLDEFTDDFKADNPMWIMDPPEVFDANEWIFVLFSTRYKKAIALAEIRSIKLINKAAKGGAWQAAAWWLERRIPATYGRKDQVSLQGVAGGEPIHMEAHPSVEGLLDKIMELEAAETSRSLE
jgi:transposase